ncbi:membrane protein [Caballeronia hypogeia]|uniref:Membrane protein n=1 Tax=Caballeronia hypogeia TaxID=1777140 RepID=A0A158DSP9_9BURK|nr:DUF2165 domain-containing protein [Caballeronia hypogeia]SAK97614.1 membrane protein [Caballeronia hypogeia]
MLQHAGYDLIILLETVTALLYWAGVIAMWRARRQQHAGLTLGYLTWQVCFMSIGGEWFDMWMSKQWNGEDSAFRFFMTFLVILIFVTRFEAPDAPTHPRDAE